MLKKYLAIFMLFVAWAIMFGHNIIPHHHHDNDHDLTDHHHADHHHANHQHDGDEDNVGLSHLFSHFIHSEDGFIFTASHNISNIFSKQLLSMVAVLPDNFSLNEFLIPPLLYKPPAERFIYTLPHSLSSGLRAPPSFIS